MSIGSPEIQYLPFSFTFQPGSTPTAPVSVSPNIGDIWCYSIEVEVPIGPGGAMGFALTYANTQILPFSQAASYLVVDGYQKSFDVRTELGKSLQLVGYNTGYWPHTVYLRFAGIPIAAYQQQQPIPPASPLDLSQLGS